MCLAIYAPAGSNIPKKNLTNGFETHSDGAGMAWAADGKLHIRKGIFKVEELLEQYDKVKQYPCLIHFRKATSGKVDATNCHPFLFNDGKLALVHNGIISIKCNIEGLSDTAHFVKLVLEPLVKTYGVPINDGSLQYLLATSVGTDKLAILTHEGLCYITNEDKGTWDGGVWYSNTSFRWAPTKRYTTGGNYQGTGMGYGAHSSVDGSAGDYKHRHWRKHWEEGEDDEKYLDFWRKAIANAADHSEKSSPVGGLTQKINTPLLLTDGTAGNGGEHKMTVDEGGNVIVVEELPDDVPAPPFFEGQMCEYGWFDAEVEADIAGYQKTLGLSRGEAMIRVFNER